VAENGSTTAPSDGAIMERAFSYCNESMKTIILQCRRLQTSEPEDSDFLFRKLADLRFLILSLDRLYKSAHLMRKVPSTMSDVDKALRKFNNSIPFLKKFRDVGEHFDEYSVDSGRRDDVTRFELQVGKWNDDSFEWLGETLNILDTKNAAKELFIAMRDIKNNFFSQT